MDVVLNCFGPQSRLDVRKHFSVTGLCTVGTVFPTLPAQPDDLSSLNTFKQLLEGRWS